MSDRTEVAQNLALAAVAAIVVLVLAGVLALAIGSRGRGAPAAAAVASQPADAIAAQAPGSLSSPAESLYFESGSAALPADAGELLARVADAARARAGAAVLISGYHDATGDPARNAELAKQRALAVRHALEAHGVAPAQLLLARPAVTTGAGDARQARRVVLTLQ